MNEFLSNFSCASVASFICAVTSYPLDTIKVKEQNRTYSKLSSLICKMTKRNIKVF